MNSFSHYSFGAVAAWAFQTIGGLRSLVRAALVSMRHKTYGPAGHFPVDLHPLCRRAAPRNHAKSRQMPTSRSFVIAGFRHAAHANGCIDDDSLMSRHRCIAHHRLRAGGQC